VPKPKFLPFSYLCAKLNSKRTKPATAHTLDRWQQAKKAQLK